MTGDHAPRQVEPVGDLLAVDPGLVHPAAALFRGGVLVVSERVRLDPDLKLLPVAARCTQVAAAVVRWAIGRQAEPRYLVVEWPQIYRASKSKGDPNDLVSLAGICGALAGMLSIAVVPREVALVVLSPTPSEWAGQVPKATEGDPWVSPRAARVADKLSRDERGRVQDTHDAIDAAGMGLWSLGRFRHLRVLPGITSP